MPSNRDRERHATHRLDPPSVAAVCARCGRLRPLVALRADEALYAQVRAQRRVATLAVPLACVNRQDCDRHAVARQQPQAQRALHAAAPAGHVAGGERP